jgi:hypothetical protein
MPVLFCIEYLEKKCTIGKYALTVWHRSFFSFFIFIIGSKASLQMSMTMRIKHKRQQ